MKYIFVLSFYLLAGSSHTQGQLLVGSNTNLTTGTTSIATNSSVVNRGGLILGAGTTLHLLGQGTLSSDNDLLIPNLFMLGSDYSIAGTVFCQESLQLKNGTLSPEQNAKLVVERGATVVSENDAHVNGQLHLSGKNNRFYPLGKNGVYTPVTLMAVSDNREIGLEAFNQDLRVAQFPADVVAASSNWYWEITAPPDFEGAQIQLPITPTDACSMGASGNATVLQTDSKSTSAIDLGRRPNSDFLHVTSELPAVGPYVLLGFASEVIPVIHNIITPRNDDKNPFLVIEHIDAMAENEVILLDRWGQEVFRERNFANYARNGNGGRPYDGAFDQLPSGSYICLLKYQGAVKKQVVTIVEE